MGNCCASEEIGPKKASYNKPIQHPMSAGERMHNKYDAETSSILSRSTTEKTSFANNLIYYESNPSSRRATFVGTKKRSRPASPISSPRPKVNSRFQERSVSPSRDERPSPTISNSTPSNICSPPKSQPSDLTSSPNLFNTSTLTAPRRQLGRAAEGDLLNVIFKAIKRVSTPEPVSRCISPEPLLNRRSISVHNQEPEVLTTEDESQPNPKFKKYNMGFDRSLIKEFNKSRERILNKHNV